MPVTYLPQTGPLQDCLFAVNVVIILVVSGGESVLPMAVVARSVSVRTIHVHGIVIAIGTVSSIVVVATGVRSPRVDYLGETDFRAPFVNRGVALLHIGDFDLRADLSNRSEWVSCSYSDRKYKQFRLEVEHSAAGTSTLIWPVLLSMSNLAPSTVTSPAGRSNVFGRSPCQACMNSYILVVIGPGALSS